MAARFADGPDRATCIARVASIGGSLAVAGLAAGLMADLSLATGSSAWEFLRVALVFVTTLWLAWGAAQALLGLLPSPREIPTPPLPAPTAATILLVPICAEDAKAVAARVSTMRESCLRAGLSVDVAILSDSQHDTDRAAEARAFRLLILDRTSKGRVYYRNRTNRRGRKAGNIEDFVRRSGAAYEFAVILDADSLMDGASIAHLTARMQADPGLGLLQTLPRIVGSGSVFGRAMQFSSHFYAPVFARGLSRLQGVTGPFWGHNAIVRVRALAECCGLPALEGKPPFGGEILSHDYVEAALLSRGGWRVEMDPGIFGSYEEGPDDLIAFARRDRRWCQGNLQHLRLLSAPGLAPWSRFVFVQGILSYLVSVFWAGFLVASVAAAATHAPPDYFPAAHQLFPAFPDDGTRQMVALALGVGGLLLLPKLAILADAIRSGRVAGFGGAGRAALSVLGETALSTVLAPLLLAWQLRAVIEVFAGRDGGWPATRRDAPRPGLAQGWRAAGWISGLGAATLAVVFWVSPGLTAWLLPVALPMLAAPVVIALSARPVSGSAFRVPCDDDIVTNFRKRLATPGTTGTVFPREQSERRHAGAPGITTM